MKKEKYLGINLAYPSNEEIGGPVGSPVFELMVDWKNNLGIVIKGTDDESYFVITGANLDKKNFGLTGRFLNPYFELTGRPRDFIIPANTLVNIVVGNDPVLQYYKENLKKIREEIQRPQ